MKIRNWLLVITLCLFVGSSFATVVDCDVGDNTQQTEIVQSVDALQAIAAFEYTAQAVQNVQAVDGALTNLQPVQDSTLIPVPQTAQTHAMKYIHATKSSIGTVSYRTGIGKS